MTDFSLSDLAAVTNNDGFAGGNAWIMVLLFAMIFGNGGFFGNGNGRGGEQFATTAEVQAGFNQQDTGSQLRGITYGLADGFYAMNNAINAGTAAIGGQIANEARTFQDILNTDFCQMQRNIDATKFDMANYTAATQAAIHAEGEATRNMIQKDKIECLQNQVNQLQLQQALCGVPKVSTAAWGIYPYSTCGCGCNGNI